MYYLGNLYVSDDMKERVESFLKKYHLLYRFRIVKMTEDDIKKIISGDITINEPSCSIINHRICIDDATTLKTTEEIIIFLKSEIAIVDLKNIANADMWTYAKQIIGHKDYYITKTEQYLEILNNNLQVIFKLASYVNAEKHKLTIDNNVKSSSYFWPSYFWSSNTVVHDDLIDSLLKLSYEIMSYIDKITMKTEEINYSKVKPLIDDSVALRTSCSKLLDNDTIQHAGLLITL